MKILPPRVRASTYSFQLFLVPGSCFLLCLLTCLRLQGQSCNDLSVVSLDADCSVAVTPDMVLEGTYDDSLFSVSLSTLAGAPLGNVLTAAQVGLTVQATVTEVASGNSCWGLLVVEDHLAPVLSCTDLVLPCAVPQFGPTYLANVLNLPAAWPVVTENCGPYTLTFLDTWTDLGCADALDRSALLQRVWTATDPSGNQSTCTQQIHIQRVHVGQIQFPADTIIDCANPLTDPAQTGQPFFTAFGQHFPLYPDQQACELNVAYQDQILNTCAGSWKILRTWTILDDCLPTANGPTVFNPLQFIQVIQVQDKKGPVFACPKDTVVYTDPFVCARSFDLPDVVLSDNCSPVASIRADWEIDGTPYSLMGALTSFPGNNPWNPDTLGQLGLAENLPAGIVRIRYLVTDGCGNTSSCSFRLTVSDGVPPQVACDEYTQVALGNTGEALVLAKTFDDGSLDNCSPVYFKARRMDPNGCQANDKFFDAVKFCCADVGDTVTVILRVYDLPVDTGAIGLTVEENHANECMVQVLVEDKLKPLCSAPLHTTVSCANFDPTLEAFGQAAFADNCCLDSVWEQTPNYVQFDTFCNRGTIVRTFRALDCHGLSSVCTQRVIVDYEQQFSVKFPDDIVVSDCDTTGVYGPEPVIYDQDCEQMAVSFHDEVSAGGVQSCYRIERVWSIINWCSYNSNLPLVFVPNPNPSPDPLSVQNLPGPVVAPKGHTPPPSQMRISPNDPTPTDYSLFWTANTNGYVYRQIISVHDDVPPKIRGCPMQTEPVQFCDHTANDPQYWNNKAWTDPHIPGSHDLCEGKTDLAVTASDGCSKGNVNIRYFLYLDLDGDGVTETVINSINPPPANTVYFGNVFTPNFSGGEPRPFDQRLVPADEQYRFTILVAGFVNRSGYVRWHTAKDPTNYVIPQLPHGIHRILWIIEDGCGNETYCDYEIQVRDCRVPDLVCLNGLSTDISADKTATLWATDFLHYVDDNCTPPDQVKIGIRKDSVGTDFPLNPDGTPQTQVTFSCAELGTQPVELWAIDAAGNYTSCKTYVLVQDNFGECPTSQATVAGTLKTETGKTLQDATLRLDGNHPAYPPIDLFHLTNADGFFRFYNALPFGVNCTLTPAKDNDALNGVSTLDLFLMNKHVLGQEPLTTPYRMIAADVNRSGSITTADILELRKLILGMITDFQGNTSWRFVDKNYGFPNPANPFQENFPESRYLSDLQSNSLQEDFIAVKTGDVNGNAVTNSLVQVDERSAGVLFLELAPGDPSRSNWDEDPVLKAGETFSIRLYTDSLVAAYQFTLLFPKLELLQLTPNEPLSDEHFASFPERHLLTASFYSAEPVATGCTLLFRAQSDGRLSQMLSLSSQVTRAEAYAFSSGTPEKMDLALRFGTADRPLIKGQALEVYGNQPNPWQEYTQVRFYVPEDGDLEFRVTDNSGKQVFYHKAWYAKGYHTLRLDRQLAEVSGVLYLQLYSATQSAGLKMIRG
ncbi:MAG: hypothetical protein IT260_11545 [Saprospiraceae bacterium]|nr:hypothetical protein [Saprospiraceae bacterium]